MSRNSLFFRFAVTLVLSMLLFQAATMALVWGLLLRPLVKASATDLAELVELSVSTWQDAEPAGREARRARLAAHHSIDVSPALTPLRGTASWLPLMRNLSQGLSRMYLQPVVVVEDGDDFAFTLTRHEESVLVRLPASRVPTQPMLALVGMFIASLIASASVAYLLARRLTQPLRDAALTAYRVGRRELPQLNNPDGADELIELTTSFNRMAREVDALVNNRTMLLAGVSHDLRSPLARLRLAIELARDTRDWQLLDAMQSYVDTLASLLDDYLDFAQGAAGAARSLVALDRECRALAEEFAPRVRVTGEPVFVEVNHVGLLRILRNTIENALRYGGTGRVEIDWVVVAGQVEIRIADRGPGFARAPAELLQPFARGERSRNARTGGLGLGLAVCNMIAQAQGWTFNIENRPGGGARARLTVPHAPR